MPKGVSWRGIVLDRSLYRIRMKPQEEGASASSSSMSQAAVSVMPRVIHLGVALSLPCGGTGGIRKAPGRIGEIPTAPT